MSQWLTFLTSATGPSMPLLPIALAGWCITLHTHYDHRGFSDSLRGPWWVCSPAALEGLNTAASKHQVWRQNQNSPSHLPPLYCTNACILEPESLYYCQEQRHSEVKWACVQGHRNKNYSSLSHSCLLMQHLSKFYILVYFKIKSRKSVCVWWSFFLQLNTKYYI